MPCTLKVKFNVLIILGLLLFSLQNTTNEINNVNACEVKDYHNMTH